jgi:2-keto-4-pentenoate hydratase
MTKEQAEHAARLLVAARRTRRWLDALPAELRPAGAADAYAVQEAVVRLLGAGVGGWKTGAPSATSEAQFAPIFADAILPSPARIPASELRLFGIELEIGFRLGRELPARREPYTAAEAAEAIASMHPTLEIVESRFLDLRAQDKPSLLADMQSNFALVYGPEATGWRGADLARPPGRVIIDGEVASEVTSGNSGGDPLRLLAALATHCAARGRPLRAGDFVTTGSCTGMLFARARASVVGEFDAFGRVEAAFPD